MQSPSPPPLALLTLLALATCAPAPRILTQAPSFGDMKPGEIALVDDGACPPGQITQIVGGSSRVYRTNIPRDGAARQSSCIPRPQ